MSLLTQILENHIKVPLESRSKEKAIRELTSMLHGLGKIQDEDALFQAVMERESLGGSTGLGGGLALPHAKLDDLDEAILCLGISREGIEFDSLDCQPVHLMFMVITPSGQPGIHIQALGEVAELVRSEETRDMLIHAPDGGAVISILRQNGAV